MKRIKIKAAALLCAALALTAAGCSYGFDFDGYVGSNGGSENAVDAADSGEVVVHFLDVGQGDSIFIELANGDTMLIDAGTGGSGDDIAEYITDEGYSDIDYLVATHPHADHIGGMKTVIEALEIGDVYMPDCDATTKTYENLLEAIDSNGLTVTTAEVGDYIVSDEELTVEILGPSEIDESNLNNSSIILKLCYGSTSFLFIGDAEKEELESIEGDISADVLKVGHHGSRTSTTESFLERVQPKYGVISCGKDNDYGHPHSEALELLEQFNVEYFRTDECGTVIITSDGNDIKTETEK